MLQDLQARPYESFLCSVCVCVCVCVCGQDTKMLLIYSVLNANCDETMIKLY